MAVLRRGRCQSVTLEEVAPAARAPIIRRYAAVAPGGRVHLGVERDEPIEAYEQVAKSTPVFRIAARG